MVSFREAPADDQFHDTGLLHLDTGRRILNGNASPFDKI